MSILSDAVYRVLSGNDNPSAEQVVAGYENAKGHVISQFVIYPVASGCYLAFGVVSFFGGLYTYLKDEWKTASDGSYDYLSIRKPKIGHIYMLGLLCCILSMEGLYTPVVFAYFSIFVLEQQSYSADGLTMPNTRRGSIAAKGGPNVIFIQHESLAGFTMNTEKGKAAMPYFQSLMHHDPDMYVFEHTRSVSGNTIDAMPALLIGCLPFTAKGIDFVQSLGRSIGYEFYRYGYHTASFCSRNIDKAIMSGQWKILYDLFVGGMDMVVDPMNRSIPLDNLDGTDDRRMLQYFSEWLTELGPLAQGPPFYAQFYAFNTHYPYMKDSTYQETDRYYSSLRTVDEFLQGLFDILSKTGQLNNTIIIGSGDHGEHVVGRKYVRLGAYSPQILSTASYIYYPSHLMHNKSIAGRLRQNTKQLTTTLDLYPTIRSILHDDTPRNGIVNWTEVHRGCMTGVDLAAVDIPDNRVVAASNSISSAGIYGHLWALMTKDSALYHRKHSRAHKPLQQGKNSSYVMSFRGCEGRNCLVDLDESGKDQFRHVLETFKNDSRIRDEVKKSDSVEFVELLVNS